MKSNTYEILGNIGILIMLSVLAYLILKILGVFHSPGFEEVLTAALIGQLFYTGYNHKALKEIERRIQNIENEFHSIKKK